MNPQPPTCSTVHLVGAGPGDPMLITLRGRMLLDRADVVLYDALIDPRLLKKNISQSLIFVGKRAGEHAMPQREIERLMIELARSGKRVVRLKGGDPMIFGRGGEECMALLGAGVPYEVVPGVTSAIAAAACAGIPLTHRDLNTSVTFVTGHARDDASDDALDRHDWPTLAKLPCLAFYMGLASLPTICTKLIEHGMDAGLPAATIQNGATARQRVVLSNLTELPEAVARAGLGSPAMTIVGHNVAMRAILRWYERRPLFGQTIAVTRAATLGGDFVESLAELGAEVVELPTVRIEPVAGAQRAALKNVVGKLGDQRPFDWLVFASATTVRMIAELLDELELDARVFAGAKVAVVGEATRRALKESLGLRADLMPSRFTSELLTAAILEQGDVAGKRFLIFRGEDGSAVLETTLKARQAEVVSYECYKSIFVDTLPDEWIDRLQGGGIQWMTFSSASAVRATVRLLGDSATNALKGVRIASIGPLTSAAAREAGLDVTAEADPHTFTGLVDCIVARSRDSNAKLT